MSFSLILTDPKADLCDAWKTAFEPYTEVKVVNDYFENLPEFDCMVSAANSFGLMDGGVDFAIINFFGGELQKRVQEVILRDYLGEQPVGTCFIVETGVDKHPYLAHTPTMRVPMYITRTDNVYLAMLAMLKAVHFHNQKADATNTINTVACPGLGTQAGKVSAKEAARQMALAYKNFKNPPKYISWAYADKIQQEVIFGGDLWN
jgi:O-acetyl-ADP-ribose deacetylase (regulator of RNase III)